MSYCTATEVLHRMGYDDSTPGNPLQQRIDDAITAAKVAIDNDTGRTFDQTTTAREFGAEANAAALYVPDLVSVSSLKLDDDDDGVFETTVTDYELDTLRDTQIGWPYEVVRLLDRTYPHGGRRRRRVEITGTWGWSAVPAPINQACALLAARLSQRSSAALFGVQSFGELGVQGIRSRDPDYLNLIGPYRKPLVA